MNLVELRDELRPQLWPDGEQENLVAAHNNFYQEALWLLNHTVDCFRFNHEDVHDHCATFFNCGMTVIPKPNGAISKIYVIDRINPDTGLEDAAVDPEPCRKVIYNQVDFCFIEQYMRMCERCSGATVSANADAIISSLFGIFRVKRRYPRPTDEGMESLPPLPPGFHYPQPSTDASGRSASGVWAIHRGRIYIAPWIQSTETVVIEWQGVKSKWSDVDTIEDDIKFKEAVKLFVGWKHESTFGEASRAENYKDQLFGNPQLGIPGAVPQLMHWCREQMRIRTCESAKMSGASAARGIGTSSTTGGGQTVYVNDQQFQYVAQCPSGQSGDPITVVVAAGTVQSALSVADANARAQQKAQADAQARLSCSDAVATYYNTPQTVTATCPTASGDTPSAVGASVTVTVPARAFSSTVSQAAADAAALQRANDLAIAQLSCTYYNAPQTVTAECPDGTSGGDETVTISASQFTSTISQEDANEKAKAEAQRQAEAALSCSGTTFVIGNTAQIGVYSAVCVGRPTGHGGMCPSGVIRVQVVIPENTYTRLTTAEGQTQTQFELNQQAQQQAQLQAQQQWTIQCNQRRQSCV